MSHSHESKTPRPIRFLFENSLFLVAGAVGALVWANTDKASYDNFTKFKLKNLVMVVEPAAAHGAQDAEPAAETDHKTGTEQTHKAADGDHAHDDHAHDDHSHDDHSHDAEPASGAAHHDDHHEGGHGHHEWTLTLLINDVLMAFFFAIAGKEVWESMLPGGALSNPRKAATPLLATLGGIAGPALVYVGGVLAFSTWSELGSGWAVPCATDIAFSYLVARIIFGPGHPAIAFLLLLAIADDAAGLIILAVFYPSGPLSPAWLLLSLGGMVLGFVFHKVFRFKSFWWYLLIPGSMSWYSFYMAGIHPALGLVPIIPCMPHAGSDLGIFAREELGRDDTLNAFEHWWKNPVEIFLGLFGLANAGVVLSSSGTGTWLVLAGLLIGKPVGITFFTWLGQKVFGLEIPGGMTYRHVVSLGMIAGIGFTVALFVSTAAFDEGPTLDAVKMGALGSFGAAILAYVGARALGIRAVTLTESAVAEPVH